MQTHAHVHMHTNKHAYTDIHAYLHAYTNSTSTGMYMHTHMHLFPCNIQVCLYNRSMQTKYSHTRYTHAHNGGYLRHGHRPMWPSVREPSKPIKSIMEFQHPAASPCTDVSTIVAQRPQTHSELLKLTAELPTPEGH